MSEPVNHISFGNGKEVILQVFDWNTVVNQPNSHYNYLLSLVDQIADAGFTAVWMPPPWYEASSNNVGYFWSTFSKNSKYGTDQELKILARKFQEKKIKPIYDLVINHKNRDDLTCRTDSV